MMTKVSSVVRRMAGSNAWGYILFWPWNLVFCTFMLFGFAPLILVQVLVAVAGGIVPIRVRLINPPWHEWLGAWSAADACPSCRSR